MGDGLQSGELLNTKSAARMLDLTTEGVRFLERSGQIAAIRTASGMRLFLRRHVQELAERRAAAKGENYEPRS